MASQYNQVPFQITPPIAGGIATFGVDFRPKWLAINNPSSYYVSFPGAPTQIVPPFTIGAVIPWNIGPGTIAVNLGYTPSGSPIRPVINAPITILATDSDQIFTSPGTNTLTSGSVAMSVPDQTQYSMLLDFARRLNTSNPVPSWWIYPVGRMIMWEGFEGIPTGAAPPFRSWVYITGSATIIDTNSHDGTQCLQLVPTAAAGAQAGVYHLFPLFADEAFSTNAKIVVGGFFQPQDSNWRNVYIRVVVDDSAQSWECWVAFTRRENGTDLNEVQYLDSTGILTSVDTYAISDQAVWHYLVIVIDYRQGLIADGGYFNYNQIRMDDFAYSFPASVSGLADTTSGVRQSTVELFVTDDNANTTTMLFDDIVVCDLSGDLNQ